jgi:hypothetical protein
MRGASLLVLLLAGCTTVETHRDTGSHSPRPDESTVAIYASPQAPREILQHPVVEIGRPEGRDIGRIRVKAMLLAPWEWSVRKAQARAREMGGTAIHVQEGDRGGAWPTLRSELWVNVYRR